MEQIKSMTIDEEQFDNLQASGTEYIRSTPLPDGKFEIEYEPDQEEGIREVIGAS